MKEYGIDLQKQYTKLIHDELALIGRIKKRRDFLIKNATPDILRSTGKVFKDSDDPKAMLADIIAIEKAYTDQAQQLNLFGSGPK